MGRVQIKRIQTYEGRNAQFFELTMVRAARIWAEFRATEPFPGLGTLEREFRRLGIKTISHIISIEVDAAESAVVEFIQKVEMK